MATEDEMVGWHHRFNRHKLEQHDIQAVQDTGTMQASDRVKSYSFQVSYEFPGSSHIPL